MTRKADTWGYGDGSIVPRHLAIQELSDVARLMAKVFLLLSAWAFQISHFSGLWLLHRNCFTVRGITLYLRRSCRSTRLLRS